MEQLSFDIPDTLSEKEQLYNCLVKEIDDAEYSEFLSVEYLLNLGKVVGLSVKAKSSIAVRIQYRKKQSSFIEFRVGNAHFFDQALVTSLDDEWSKIEYSSFDEVLSLAEPIAMIFINALKTFEQESFGCCSRYLECSDAKKCLHPSKIKSEACQYKSNLEHGRIFYGKNRNV